MAKLQHVGHFVITAECTDDVVVSGIGFQPTSLMLRLKYDINDSIGGGNVADQSVQIGAITGGESVNESDTGYSIYSGDMEAAIKSFDADGFTIEVLSNSSLANVYVMYFAIRSA